MASKYPLWAYPYHTKELSIHNPLVFIDWNEIPSQWTRGATVRWAGYILEKGTLHVPPILYFHPQLFIVVGVLDPIWPHHNGPHNTNSSRVLSQANRTREREREIWHSCTLYPSRCLVLLPSTVQSHIRRTLHVALYTSHPPHVTHAVLACGIRWWHHVDNTLSLLAFFAYLQLHSKSR